MPRRARGRLVALVLGTQTARGVGLLHPLDVEWLATNFLFTQGLCATVWSGGRSYVFSGGDTWLCPSVPLILVDKRSRRTKTPLRIAASSRTEVRPALTAYGNTIRLRGTSKRESLTYINYINNLDGMEAAGVEPHRPPHHQQLSRKPIDQYRQNRSKPGVQVHNRYTESAPPCATRSGVTRCGEHRLSQRVAKPLGL